MRFTIKLERANHQMKLWIDADACPRVIKDILIRMAERTHTSLTFVSNSWLKLPDLAFISLIQVSQGLDVADDEIVKLCEAGDLIITADIPLAAKVVAKGALALDYRGKFYDAENIRHILSIRNFMSEMRESGVETGGPSNFSKKDQQLFANELDKFITRHRQA